MLSVLSRIQYSVLRQNIGMRVRLAKYFKLKILIKQTIGVLFKETYCGYGLYCLWSLYCFLVCGSSQRKHKTNLFTTVK